MVMSREEQRHRIPTSDELERQGALVAATGEPRAQRRGLLRFFRASRFRVADDVAARKHVGTPEARSAVTPTGATAPTGGADRAPGASGESAVSADNRPAAIPSPRRSADAIIPRTIRIDPAIKQRRGLGRHGDNR